MRTAHPSWRRPARNWAPHGRCEPVASPRSRRPSRRRRPRAASPRGRRGGRRIARAPSGVCLIPPTARAPRRSASRTAHRTCSPMRSRDPGDIAPSATHAVHGHPHPESHSPDRGQRLDRLPSAAPRGKGYARGRTNPRAIELGRHRESSEAKIEGCVFMAPGYRGDNQYSRAGPVGDPRHPPARTIGSPGTWQDAPDRPRARTGSGYQRSGLSPRHQIHRGSGLVAGVRLRGQGQWRTRTDLLTVDMTLRQPAQRHSAAPGAA
ncbi:Uncharacterised protein [Mycobacterium tuberculosis]|uniref:Uncharacterized protein n=2 Tax=Mycobacterium tuberculosis TaxID=1773 RepID=A0A655FV97_MYCTX|nr:Uncharacterised protein [Mycobacterium tuberculosis]CNW15533.1 Uncharacterised protein [Mycobacterium tuberculosis]